MEGDPHDVEGRCVDGIQPAAKKEDRENREGQGARDTGLQRDKGHPHSMENALCQQMTTHFLKTNGRRHQATELELLQIPSRIHCGGTLSRNHAHW